MKCVFPRAVKLWQKVLCGTVGVVALGTSLTAFSVAVVNIPSPPDWVFSFLIAEKDTREPSKLADFLNEFLYDSDNQRKISMVGAPLFAGTSVMFAVLSYKHPFWFWPATKEEFMVFFNAIKGTECCDIVKKTARFAITGPASIITLVSCTATMPMLSVIFGTISFKIGRNFWDNNIQNRART